MNFTVNCSSSSLPQNYPGTVLKSDRIVNYIKSKAHWTHIIPLNLKGIVHPKNKRFCHLLTLKLFQICMSFFVLLNTKEDFWRMWITKHCCCSPLISIVWGKNTMEVNGDRNNFIQVWNNLGMMTIFILRLTILFNNFFNKNKTPNCSRNYCRFMLSVDIFSLNDR